jgi:hypothetical protein
MLRNNPSPEISVNVLGLHGSRRAEDGAPHHEGLRCRRETRPHPEEPAKGGRLEGWAAKTPPACTLSNAIVPRDSAAIRFTADTALLQFARGPRASLVKANNRNNKGAEIP